MIVPRIRLILLVAVIMLSAGFLAAWWPEATAYTVGAVALFMVVCALDIHNRKVHLNLLSVAIPEISRMTVDKTTQIKVTVRKPEAMTVRLRFGLALPGLIVSEQKDLQVLLEKGSDKGVLNWSCRPIHRGRYVVTRCHLEAESQLGLWALRRRVSLVGEIRVYPNLISGQQNLLGLFSRKEWGVRTQRRVGKGREFEQLREYLPGDSFEDIDWKATARRRHPITRVYQVEQSQEIFVVLDASRLSTRSAAYLMDRRSITRSKSAVQAATIFERYITAALVMAVAADKLLDRYGLLIFGDKPECFIKAGRGVAHYNACRDALYNRQPKIVSPDFDELFSFMGTHLRKRALLVFLTNLDDPVLAESFVDAMRSATRQHILMVNMYRPPGAHPLFTSPDIKKIQGIHQHLVGHMLWASINETNRRFRQQGASLHLLDDDQFCNQLVNQYMDVKQRQII